MQDQRTNNEVLKQTQVSHMPADLPISVEEYEEIMKAEHEAKILEEALEAEAIFAEEMEERELELEAERHPIFHPSSDNGFEPAEYDDRDPEPLSFQVRQDHFGRTDDFDFDSSMIESERELTEFFR